MRLPIFVLSLCLAMSAFSPQSLWAQATQVVDGFIEIEWTENDEAPVGQWNPGSGYWLDEIPWGVYERSWPQGWNGGQVLVDEEQWTEISVSSLTARQKSLLKEINKAGMWQADRIEGGAQWLGPLLRWNDSKAVYEKLDALVFAFGQGFGFPDANAVAGERTRNWPDAHPLQSGEILRLSISASGVYRIDRDWMVAAGFDPDTLDPRRVHLYGNGGALLPMDNDVDRPLGLHTVAVEFEGSEDGSWDEDDVLIFWGQGPNTIDWDNGSICAIRMKTNLGISLRLIRPMTSGESRMQHLPRQPLTR